MRMYAVFGLQISDCSDCVCGIEAGGHIKDMHLVGNLHKASKVEDKPLVTTETNLVRVLGSNI